MRVYLINDVENTEIIWVLIFGEYQKCIGKMRDSKIIRPLIWIISIMALRRISTHYYQNNTSINFENCVNLHSMTQISHN